MPESSVAPDLRRGAHSSLPLPRSVLAGFMLAAAAVLLIAYFSYLADQRRASTAADLTHTLQVTRALQAFLSTMIDAQTGQRGYLLTADDRGHDRRLTRASGRRYAARARDAGGAAVLTAPSGAARRRREWPLPAARS
jgi:hypothetical protein